MDYTEKFTNAFYEEMIRHGFQFVECPNIAFPTKRFIRAHGVMFQMIAITSWKGIAEIKLINYPFWKESILSSSAMKTTHEHSFYFHVAVGENGLLNSKMLFEYAQHPDFNSFAEAARDEYIEHILPRLDETYTIDDYLRVWCYELPDNMTRFQAIDEAAIFKTRAEESMEPLKNYVRFKESKQRYVSQKMLRAVEMDQLSTTNMFVKEYYNSANYNTFWINQIYGFVYEVENIK